MARRLGVFQEGLADELTVYVRHSAWLNATVDRGKNEPPELPQYSRIERQRKDREDETYQPEMPQLDAAGYLAALLFEIGPTVPAGMSAGPISFQEIAAFCDLTGTPLQPWEARMVRRLSVAYLSESHKAAKIGAAPPWAPDGSKPQVTAAQAALRALAK